MLAVVGVVSFFVAARLWIVDAQELSVAWALYGSFALFRSALALAG